MNEIPFGTGALESPFDSRTYRHDTTLASPLTKGGVRYQPDDIEHQHNVGICTAAAVVENAEKALGRKFSMDFNYLCQKKFYDLGWFEGSSIFHALKVGKAIGFLPLEEFPWVTENDRYLPYEQYAAKLKAIPDAEIERLKKLCVNKLAGYAQIGTDSQSLAKGILDSKAGLVVRYSVTDAWWKGKDGKNSWNPNDINPLRNDGVFVAGHAINQTYFDFTIDDMFELANTWGTQWCDQGTANTVWPGYGCTEAWIPYYDTVPTPAPSKFIFTKNMQYGERSNDVSELQKRLNGRVTGFYGDETKALVFAYQKLNVPLTWTERYVYMGRYCGERTRAALNKS